MSITPSESAPLRYSPGKSSQALDAKPEPEMPRIRLGHALAFPFTQRNWPQALGYIAAIQFVPILGFLVIRGWRFDIAKRIGDGDAHRLPDWRQAWHHLREGTLLFAVTQLYFLPFYLLLIWPRSGILWSLVHIAQWLYEWLFTDLTMRPFWEVLEPGLKSLAIFLVLILLVPPLISAVVESATQRYANNGRIAALFEFWHAIALACGDLRDVARIELSIVGLNIAVTILSLLLTLTVGGTIFIPAVMIPIYMWTRGALMGQWIAKNRWEQASNAS
jgi:hypothetical protein